jgi:hypothetical protein
VPAHYMPWAHSGANLWMAGPVKGFECLDKLGFGLQASGFSGFRLSASGDYQR